MLVRSLWWAARFFFHLLQQITIKKIHLQGTYKLLQMGLYSLLGIYIIFIIGISYYFSKEATEEDYLISGRDRNTWHILASKFAGAIGVSTFITYTAYTYRFGATGVLALLLGILVGYNLFAFCNITFQRYSLVSMPNFVLQP